MRIKYLILIFLLMLTTRKSDAQVYGCTDRLARNYEIAATINDGSCEYNPANIKPVESILMAGILSETSGLTLWNNNLLTHSDNLIADIYCLDTLNGTIVNTIRLREIRNTDWEEISQDEDFLYIGDFGNNSGDRGNLKIFIVRKNSLWLESKIIDSIKFTYSDQINYIPDSNNTDFDCEAFIVSKDSIYLFTKQWVSQKTSVYSLPKNPGKYIAELRATFDVNGLITGAAYLESERIIVLSGYSKTLDPFLFLLYDFNGHDFFSGNKRKIEILLPFHQVEGIATENGIKYFISNEFFSLYQIRNYPQRLHILDLSPFLGAYLNFSLPYPDSLTSFIVSPVPSHDYLTVKSLPDLLPRDYSMLNLAGQKVKTGKLVDVNSVISVSNLAPGIYILKIGEEKRHFYKVIKE